MLYQHSTSVDTVGRFYEFYFPADAEIASQFGLVPMRRNHRGAIFGFPKPQLDQYMVRLPDMQQSLLVVTEQTAEQGCIQRRWPVARYVWKCA